MKFVTDITEKEYREFWEKNEYNHFLQSYEWGQIQKKNRNQTPVYVGMRDEKGNILCEALLLKKSTPLHMCYFYSPRGFTMDFNNQELLEAFTKGLKEFLKEQNAIYLKLDPPIMYQEVDENAKKIEGGKNNYELFNNIVKLGYHHNGFNLLYDHNQPRFTFRTFFNKYETFDDVVKSFHTSFYRPIKRSYNYDLEIYMDDSIDTFYNLAELVASKDGFNAYPHDYYKNVYDYFSKHGYIKIFNAKINPTKLIEKFKEELENEKKDNRKEKIRKDIEYFENLAKEHPTEYTCASLICTYSKKGSWSLYIGNDEAAAYTGTVNRLYYEYIKDAYENKYEYADLFGVCGDPTTKFKNLAGIFEYKRKIGGDCVEFVGEFDLINKPFWYHVLPVLLKVYRGVRKIIKR